MRILVVDGQGGRIGAQLVRMILESFPEAELTAVGTNGTATLAMLKAGATRAATGENPLIVAARRADVIVGPVGIVVADAMLGEITERMAAAVGRAEALRILIPVNRCDTRIAGVSERDTGALLADALEKLREAAKA